MPSVAHGTNTGIDPYALLEFRNECGRSVIKLSELVKDRAENTRKQSGKMQSYWKCSSNVALCQDPEEREVLELPEQVYKAVQQLPDHMDLATEKQRAEIALLKSKVEEQRVSGDTGNVVDDWISAVVAKGDVDGALAIDKRLTKPAQDFIEGWSSQLADLMNLNTNKEIKKNIAGKPGKGHVYPAGGGRHCRQWDTFPRLARKAGCTNGGIACGIVCPA